MPRAESESPEDAIVVCFGDVVLRQNDLNTLQDRRTFLTDTCIEYAFERLEREYISSHADSSKIKIKLLRPSMVHLLAHGAGMDAATIAAILDLSLPS